MTTAGLPDWDYNVLRKYANKIIGYAQVAFPEKPDAACELLAEHLKASPVIPETMRQQIEVRKGTGTYLLAFITCLFYGNSREEIAVAAHVDENVAAEYVAVVVLNSVIANKDDQILGRAALLKNYFEMVELVTNVIDGEPDVKAQEWNTFALISKCVTGTPPVPRYDGTTDGMFDVFNMSLKTIADQFVGANQSRFRPEILA